MTKTLKPKLSQRIRNSIRFRLRPLRLKYLQRVVGPVRSKSGPLSRLLEFPLGIGSPSRQNELCVARPSELGDVLMCTPALREFKKQHPHIPIKFFTHYPDLVRGLPYIDVVGSYQDRPWDSIELRYEDSLPPQRHICQIFADQLNMELEDVIPDCIFPVEAIDLFQSRHRHLPKPWILIYRKAGPWTPNKDWSHESWEHLIPHLLELGTVFEIGMGQSISQLTRPNYVNLVGKTSRQEMMAAIASASLTLGPISGPAHIAAAARVPSVVIYGGYESPICSSYPRNINLSSKMSCSPCWLRSPCPIDKECLHRITPERVLESAKSVLSCYQLEKASQENDPFFSRNYSENNLGIDLLPKI
jgi:ADP-heptose:LPS heptosyltransferase